jgi:hypothetical protein
MQSFVGETRRKATTCKTSRKWEDIIKIDVQEVEWAGMD